MPWSELEFGEHKGKSLPQVIFSDPDWFFWAYETRIFKGAQDDEAREIYRKATSIKIPQKGPETLVAEYGQPHSESRIVDLEIVTQSQPQHSGNARTFRRNVIDLSVARELKGFDKIGCRILIKQVKSYLFGSRNYKMTKKLCEDFFDDDSNFELRL